MSGRTLVPRRGLRANAPRVEKEEKEKEKEKEKEEEEEKEKEEEKKEVRGPGEVSGLERPGEVWGPCLLLCMSFVVAWVGGSYVPYSSRPGSA